MIRITTSGAMRNYKSNLMRSSNNLDYARNKVLTQRNFLSYAEDPAAATQAFQLRRAYSRTNDQLGTVKSLENKFGAAWTALQGIKKDMGESIGKVSALEGENDPTGAGRQPLGEALKSAAEGIVQTLNSKYGETFIFAGSDGENVPFSWGNDGELLFRGIPVDSGDPATRPKGTPPDPAKTNPADPADLWGTYYANNPDFAKLASTVYEKAYVDVGAGLKENGSGDLIEASAFNSAISGLDLTGYGMDKDGDPLNLASMMMKLGNIYSRCDADSGEFAPNTTDQDDAKRLVTKINDALSATTNKWTELDGKCGNLDITKERLTDSAYTLNEQLLDLEQCNLADAITELSWAQYCYNAALKVGNSILSQSLIDYMN